MSKPIYCTFCGLSSEESPLVFKEKGLSAAICSECLFICIAGIFNKFQLSAAAAPLSPTAGPDDGQSGG